MTTAEKQESPSPGLAELILRQFSSMKFAIIVLILIALASLVGMFLGEFYPVKASMDGWQEFWLQKLEISPTLFRVLVFFKFHDPFRSWWYQLLLLTLSCSLCACIIDRIPIVLRSMKLGAPRSFSDLQKSASARSFSSADAPVAVLQRLPRLFRYRRVQEGKEWRVSGSHGLISGWGPILAHTGLLCLAVGGLLASLLGYRASLRGVPGDLLSDANIPYTVRVDSFKIEYHDLGIGQWVVVDEAFLGRIVGREKGETFHVEVMLDNETSQVDTFSGERLRNQFNVEMDRGNIKDYISVVTVIEDGVEKFQSRIRVNHPLRYKSFRFYQTSFDPSHPVVDARIDSAAIVVKQTQDENAIDTIFVSSSRPYELPDGSELRLTTFLPDFRLEGDRAVSASGELRNPAVKLEVYREGAKLYHQWSFLKMEFPHSDPNAVYSFQATDIFGLQTSASYPTILEAKQNPGYGFFWLGFILATLGLILAFYLTPQRLWVAVKAKDKGGCEVIISGLATKNPDVFARRLEAWRQRLQGK